MSTAGAILIALGVTVYLWLWYRCIIVAGEKKFSFAAVIAICVLASPLVALIILTFLPDPPSTAERRLTVDELTAVFEAKAARIEAASTRDGRQ